MESEHSLYGPSAVDDAKSSMKLVDELVDNVTTLGEFFREVISKRQTSMRKNLTNNKKLVIEHYVRHWRLG